MTNTLIHKPTKAERIAVIYDAAKAIANYCGVKWEDLFSPRQTKSTSLSEARAMLSLYLNRNGLSFANIGGMLQRNESYCRDMARHVSKRLMPDDIEMMDNLPKIPNWRRVAV